MESFTESCLFKAAYWSLQDTFLRLDSNIGLVNCKPHDRMAMPQEGGEANRIGPWAADQKIWKQETQLKHHDTHHTMESANIGRFRETHVLSLAFSVPLSSITWLSNTASQFYNTEPLISWKFHFLERRCSLTQIHAWRIGILTGRAGLGMERERRQEFSWDLCIPSTRAVLGD